MNLRLAVISAAMLATSASSASAQLANVEGVVVDSATAAPLAQVRGEWRERRIRSRVVTQTDPRGRFRVALSPGLYDVVFTRVGYMPARLANVEITDTSHVLHVVLSPQSIPLDRIVVSASRTEQTQLDAPASVSVIERESIEADVRINPLEQIRFLPGVDLASKGLMQHTFEVRGPRAAMSGAVLLLTDHRYAELPSIGLNVPYFLPATREDIERIEVVRGPAAALYGPGAPRGVLHVITRSPFESRGGVVSLSAGGRSIIQGTARYATLLRPRLAFALSVDRFQGEDWPSVDSMEIRNRAAALEQGADPDTLRIGARDYSLDRTGGEARIDWRPGAHTEVITKTGLAQADAIDFTGQGPVQVRNWRAWYVQSRVRHSRLLVNTAFNFNDAGGTYFLRTGGPLVDRSRLFAVQLQHAAQLRAVDVVYGLDMRTTDPRTDGTLHGQHENDDLLTETGSYVQATTALSGRLQLVTALRVDHHSRLQNMAVSPRAGIVQRLGRTHAVRLTYNRAFSSPPPLDLFLDLRVGSLPGGLPFAVRQQAIPRTGFTFRRDCDGLCMRSPFSADGADQFLPADATLLWSEMVALLRQRGINIGDIPAPQRTDVSTTLGTLNQANRNFDPVTAVDVRDVPPLRRQITNVIELGYKGAFRSGVGLTADLHATRVHRRNAGAAVAITPNVFFERMSLEQHLARYRSAAAAAQIATALAQIPVGTVSPIETPYSADILLVSRQGQTYTVWGADLTALLPLGSRLSVFTAASWISYDSVSASLSDVPVVLAIPNKKASLEITYHDPARLRISLRTRAVGPFRPGAGARALKVAGYAVIDLSTMYRLPPTRRMSISAEVQNLFDNERRELNGAPLLGRLAIVRTRLEF